MLFILGSNYFKDDLRNVIMYSYTVHKDNKGDTSTKY
jgi:hypothetical protein